MLSNSHDVSPKRIISELMKEKEFTKFGNFSQQQDVQEFFIILIDIINSNVETKINIELQEDKYINIL